MKNVRIGIIGLGNIGAMHAGYLNEAKINGGELTAVCSGNPARHQWANDYLSPAVRVFDSPEALLNSGSVDGVIIATPHYNHSETAIKAFEHGLHVLIEKPAGVYTRQVRVMNAAALKSGKVFGIMYNQRTNPLYQKLREMIQSGELGELKRTNWIMTAWYRSQSYYDSGGWRATWAGEGGGVLLNQSSHQLDLWQWIGGMPKTVRAFCGFGKYHAIEVEDDVTAYVEYINGATGVFITSTGESPGTNRFEILGDRGKAVIENGKLSFWRLKVSERQFNQEYRGGFGEPECDRIEVPLTGMETTHPGITQNWVESILTGSPLLAPGIEGLNSLELSNAMLLSSWLDKRIDIPVDEAIFYEKLQDKIRQSSQKSNQ